MEKLTKAKILEILTVCDFSGELTENNYYDKIVIPLRKEKKYIFDNFSGVSKCVLSFSDLDFVVKIPFTGSDCPHYSYRYDEDYSYTRRTFVGDIYEEFYGASDNITHSGWDYCLLETTRFLEAKRKGYGDILAKTELLGEVKGYPIYIQPKAEIYAFCSKKEKVSEREKDICRMLRTLTNTRIINLRWIIDCYYYYGYEKTRKMFRALNHSYFDRDMHSENLGYIGNQPVIIDYSDFNS